MKIVFLTLSGLLLMMPVFAQNPVFVCADQAWAPFRTETPEGKSEGLMIYAMDRIFSAVPGLKYTLKTYPWVRAQEQMRIGEADLMITLKTPARMEYALVSDKPLYSIYFKIFTRTDHPRLKEILAISTLDDIRKMGFSTVSNQGNNWHKANVEALGIPSQYVKDDVSIVRILETGRADLAVDSPLSMGPLIKSEKMEHLIFETDIRFEEQWFYLFMSKKSRFLSLWPRINQALSSIVETPTYRETVRAAYAPFESLP